MKGDQVYLRHISDAIEKIESYVSVSMSLHDIKVVTI